MILFVDTSAFYALLDRSDDNCASATSFFTSCLDLRHTLVTSNYVVVETTALLQRRLGPEAVSAFADALLPVVTVSMVPEHVHHLALGECARGSRWGPSLVDLTSIALAGELGCDGVFAFDHHFAVAGLSILP